MTSQRRFFDLWRFQGTVGPREYASAGLIGFAIKFLMDSLIARYLFGLDWTIWSYWQNLPMTLGHQSVPEDRLAVFLAMMVITALPFIWAGTAMTLKRLRDLGAPLLWTLAFFLPFANLGLFILLSLLPSRSARNVSADHSSSSWMGRWMPRGRAANAALAVLLTAGVSLLLILFSTTTLKTYGTSLFIGVPFFTGLLSSLLYGFHIRRTRGECHAVAMMSVGFTGLALLLVAIEGVICIIMAVPLALPLAWLGGSFGYLLQPHGDTTPSRESSLAAVLFLMPMFMSAEYAIQPAAPVFPVTSSVVVHATPEHIWPHVIAFTELPPPTEWLFRLGIAYPTKAVLDRHGVGAIRHCVFSTGAFVEPIEVWDPPRHLKFSVTHTPPPMEEWTPYQHVHPPHLENFLVSKGGEFRLERLPNGSTKLEGTTWYQHHMWPAWYWQIWSDEIIHRIHLRVLTHIKSRAEKFSPVSNEQSS